MANKLENKKYHFIYKTINLINGKYYIGMHSTNDLKDDYLGSGTYLKRSIKKYGKENFKIEILHWKGNREELVNLEKEIVNEDVIKDSFCMNLKPGGLGGFVNELHKLKFMNAAKNALETYKKLIKENPDCKKKYSQICSDRNKRKPGNGASHLSNYNAFKVHKQTEETKLKQSLANKGKRTGKENSQFGTCWITKEGINKKIKKEELIPEGWLRGRKIKFD